MHSLNTLYGSKPKFLTNDFGHLNSTLGIVETVPDTFYVVANNFSLHLATLGVQKGTNSIYKVSLGKGYSEGAQTTLLAKVPEAKFLNGLTKFNAHLLLAADSALGVVWAIDTRSGKYRIVAKDPLMEPVPSNGYAEGISEKRSRV